MVRSMPGYRIVTDAPTLYAYLRQPKVWGQLAIGTLASCAMMVHLAAISKHSGPEDLLRDSAYSAITTVVAAVSSFAWLRIYFAKRPGFTCRTCGYDLQGSDGPELACPECGEKEHRSEVPAWGASASRYWLLVPGILLLLGAVAFLLLTLFTFWLYVALLPS
jgi:hypothetical protein